MSEKQWTLESLRRYNAMAQALEEMRLAEMELDDMDYIEESPRYKKAMEAAKKFHDACDLVGRL